MKQWLTGAAVAGVLIMTSPISALALVRSGEQMARVEAGEIIDDDLFIAGNTVVVEGTVMGDVYAAGNNLRITGNVTGDVFAAGGTVDVSGNVGQDVLIAGGSLNIRGAKIGDGLTMAGGNIFVSNDASVSGGLIFGGGNVNIDSPINRGVVGGGGMVNLNNRVGKSAYIGAGNLNLGSGAIINGDLVFSGENDPVLAEGASVAGQISKIWPEKMTEAGRAGREAAEGGLKLGFKLWSYLAALLTGTVLLWLLRPAVLALAAQMKINPGRNWLVGMVIMILALPVLFLIALSAFGIPLAVIVLMLFLIDIYVAQIFAGVLAGEWITKKLNRPDMHYLAVFAIGLLAYQLAAGIPYIGWMVKYAALTIFLGAKFTKVRALLPLGKK